ncbi:REP-associated tyrosine transposase [Humisphaera borealis]|uniref:Transposase n=1 Tax=Humisphaera borealis TaxID=2807512 RepID=A0A7M2X209_9BACT|nr:transposase [Humisphaera borealis]QOV91778.1 transposase [Humisphaera borealis]
MADEQRSSFGSDNGNAELQLGSSTHPVKDGEPERGVPRNVPKNWYTRGYLPHCDQSGLLQSITYRLADSLPASVLAKIEDELALLPPPKQDDERRRRFEQWLDAGHGSCLLRDPAAADCVVQGWRHFDGKRYDLMAWVVMPNHVHVMVRVYEGWTLGKIVQSWKSFTSRKIGKMLREKIVGNAELQLGTGLSSPVKNVKQGLGNAGPEAGVTPTEVSGGIWMREYWDRYIRNEQHFTATVDYIHQNPVKAGIVSSPTAWRWSSANEVLSGSFGINGL